MPSVDVSERSLNYSIVTYRLILFIEWQFPEKVSEGTKTISTILVYPLFNLFLIVQKHLLFLIINILQVIPQGTVDNNLWPDSF